MTKIFCLRRIINDRMDPIHVDWPATAITNSSWSCCIKIKNLLIVFYPARFCLASLRPYDSGNVNLVTIPSGPNTFDGMLSNESDNERESDWSCILERWL